jgi:hypothetical protein
MGDDIIKFSISREEGRVMSRKGGENGRENNHQK